jgi:hydrogenase maturation protease/hydrogenase 3 maturation protease
MIHVICLGNPMHGDDGFGPAVFRRLDGMDWPMGIRVFDAAAQGGGVGLFRECSRAIAIDALPPGTGQPGEVLRLRDYPDDPQGAAAGGVGGILAAVRRTIRPLPDVEIVGAVAICCRPFQPGLSPLVAAAVETVAVMLRRDLGGRSRKAAG